MASEASTSANGGSLAAMLEQQHARDEEHKPTVEETVDEEDLKHPPLTSLQPDQPLLVDADTPESTTLAQTVSPAPASKPVKKAPAFDVQSEELFPALGSGPKPAAPAAATWGAKKPSAATTVANGSPAKSMGTWITLERPPNWTNFLTQEQRSPVSWPSPESTWSSCA